MQKDLTTKRLQIDKANVTVVVAVSIAAFVTVFSLVATKSLLSQRSYQTRVIEKREQALDQIDKNIIAADQLTESYKQFVSATVNAIGGNPTGTGERDGDNARIILDALPSKYDYPALATSLEKLAKNQGLNIQSIEGTDDEVNQTSAETSPTPLAIEMPFTIVVNGDYAATQRLIDVFSKSIRPFYMDELEFTASDNNLLALSITGRSFYQPEKNLDFKSEVVK